METTSNSDVYNPPSPLRSTSVRGNAANIEDVT
jgi:hypothetical protein